MKDSILISEIFGPTLQGEGPLAGLPTLFVRTGGCDFRCGIDEGKWCDTPYAVWPRHRETWEEMTADDIFDRLLNLSRGFPLLVSLSGGNPALQPLEKLIDLGLGHGYEFALETQGSISKPWFSKLDHLVLSPKPPSSRMKFSPERLEDCINAAGEQTNLSLKIVVFDETDFQFARQVSNLFPALPVYLQAGTPQFDEAGFVHNEVARYRYLTASIVERTLRLFEMVRREHWMGARVGFQQHVILFGGKRGF
jgi:7-carboxy-7-deazaguanine synthase